MLQITLPLAAALMILLPGIFAVEIMRRLATRPKLVLWGAATFLAAEAMRLPLLHALTSMFASGALPVPDPLHQAAVNTVILAITAGLFEEGARYLAYRTVIPEARTWNAAVTFGAGHGGIESVLIGVMMMVGFAGVAALGTDDPRAAAYWATPAWSPLLGVAERAFAMCLHLALAVVVLQAITRRNLAWLAAAIAAHAAANVIATAAMTQYGPLASEVALAVVAVVALVVLFRLRGTGEMPEVSNSGTG